jgi:holin-like protein
MMKTVLKGLTQISLLCALALISNYMSTRFSLPLPGSIIGLVLLFFLLQFNILRMEWIELGANLLLAELLLFFIPSAVGIIQYQSLLLTNGIQILTVVIVGTILIMASSGLIAKKIAVIRGKS